MNQPATKRTESLNRCADTPTISNCFRKHTGPGQQRLWTPSAYRLMTATRTRAKPSSMNSVGWVTPAWRQPTDGRPFASSRRSAPDAVLTELALSALDGAEFLRRAKTAQPKTPVIVLTNQATEDNLLQALRLGARDFLGKSVGAKTIDEAIHSALDHRTSRRPPPMRAKRSSAAARRFNSFAARSTRWPRRAGRRS